VQGIRPQRDSVPLARAEGERRKREDRCGQPSPEGDGVPTGKSAVGPAVGGLLRAVRDGLAVSRPHSPLLQRAGASGPLGSLVLGFVESHVIIRSAWSSRAVG